MGFNGEGRVSRTLTYLNLIDSLLSNKENKAGSSCYSSQEQQERFECTSRPLFETSCAERSVTTLTASSTASVLQKGSRKSAGKLLSM